MSWTFITVTFIQDVYIFKKYPTQRQLLKTGRLLKTQEYIPRYKLLKSIYIYVHNNFPTHVFFLHGY